LAASIDREEPAALLDRERRVGGRYIPVRGEVVTVLNVF
jgi:hypothetical protein